MHIRLWLLSAFSVVPPYSPFEPHVLRAVHGTTPGQDRTGHGVVTHCEAPPLGACINIAVIHVPADFRLSATPTPPRFASSNPLPCVSRRHAVSNHGRYQAVYAHTDSFSLVTFAAARSYQVVRYFFVVCVVKIILVVTLLCLLV